MPRTFAFRLARRSVAPLAPAVLTLALSSLASSPAHAEDIFAALQRAFGGGPPLVQPVAPARQSAAGGRSLRYHGRARASLRRSVKTASEPAFQPSRSAAAAPTRGTRRGRWAALASQDPPAIKAPGPLSGGPDFSGTVDAAFVAEERKAFAETVAGKVLGSGWLYGRQTMCVRLCDGYAYPVAVLNKPDDLTVHATACRATCPGAVTALFSRPNGSEGMTSAISVGGRAYASLRSAFAYREKLVPACSCHGEDRLTEWSLPIVQDRTLRSGDIIVGKANAFVMLAGQVPRLENVLQSKILTKNSRKQIVSLIGYQPPRTTVRVMLSTSNDNGLSALQTLPQDNSVRVVLPNLY